MHGLKDKYIPKKLLDYLMYQFGPRPDYDDVLHQAGDWELWIPPQDGTLFKKDPNKKKFTGIKVAGVVLTAYTSYKIIQS
jgi:hypothetical protein